MIAQESLHRLGTQKSVVFHFCFFPSINPLILSHFFYFLEFAEIFRFSSNSQGSGSLTGLVFKGIRHTAKSGSQIPQDMFPEVPGRNLLLVPRPCGIWFPRFWNPDGIRLPWDFRLRPCGIRISQNVYKNLSEFANVRKWISILKMCTFNTSIFQGLTYRCFKSLLAFNFLVLTAPTPCRNFKNWTYPPISTKFKNSSEGRIIGTCGVRLVKKETKVENLVLTSNVQSWIV